MVLMPNVAPGGGGLPNGAKVWFVVPTGNTTFDIQATIVGHPLYNQYVAKGYAGYTTYNDARVALLVADGIPAGTHFDGWFSVNEGELGQVVNQLSVEGHFLRSITDGHFRSAWDSFVQGLKESGGL